MTIKDLWRLTFLRVRHTHDGIDASVEPARSLTVIQKFACGRDDEAQDADVASQVERRVMSNELDIILFFSVALYVFR